MFLLVLTWTEICSDQAKVWLPLVTNHDSVSEVAAEQRRHLADAVTWHGEHWYSSWHDVHFLLYDFNESYSSHTMQGRWSKIVVTSR